MRGVRTAYFGDRTLANAGPTGGQGEGSILGPLGGMIDMIDGDNF